MGVADFLGSLWGLVERKGGEENPFPANRLSSFYDFKVKSIDGKEVDLSRFKGKKVLVVNVASKCGFTKQYAELQELYERYGDKVTVLGFPANNFLWQEPGDNDEIASFCQVNYGVTFPMFEKISVRGSNQHPLYRWLSRKSYNGVVDQAPNWNFSKYLLDEEGRMLAFFPPKVSPLDEAALALITGKEDGFELAKSA